MVSTRRRIRERVVDILKAASIPTVGTRVYSNRPSIQNHELPALIVYSDDGERIETVSHSTPKYARTATFNVRVMAQQTADLDDVLDDLLELVFDALFSDCQLGGASAGLGNLRSIEPREVRGPLIFEGQHKPTGALDLSFDAVFEFEPTDPSVPLFEFETADVDWDLAGGDAVDAEDTIHVQTPTP